MGNIALKRSNEHTEKRGDALVDILVDGTSKAAELYRSGKKLWTNEDFATIEKALASFQHEESFTIRRIDDSIQNTWGVNNQGPQGDPSWYEPS